MKNFSGDWQRSSQICLRSQKWQNRCSWTGRDWNTSNKIFQTCNQERTVAGICKSEIHRIGANQKKISFDCRKNFFSRKPRSASGWRRLFSRWRKTQPRFFFSKKICKNFKLSLNQRFFSRKISHSLVKPTKLTHSSTHQCRNDQKILVYSFNLMSLHRFLRLPYINILRGKTDKAVEQKKEP